MADTNKGVLNWDQVSSLEDFVTFNTHELPNDLKIVPLVCVDFRVNDQASQALSAVVNDIEIAKKRYASLDKEVTSVE